MPIIDSLHPVVRRQALLLQSETKRRFGINIKFTQALRTELVQYALWCKGRLPLPDVNSAMKIAGLGFISESENKIVTKAKSAATSFHGYGLAFDIVIVLANGRTITYDLDADTNSDGITDWDQIGELGEELGLEWGGNFSSISDKPHFQNRLGYTIARLRSLSVPVGVVLALPAAIQQRPEYLSDDGAPATPKERPSVPSSVQTTDPSAYK